MHTLGTWMVSMVGSFLFRFVGSTWKHSFSHHLVVIVVHVQCPSSEPSPSDQYISTHPNDVDIKHVLTGKGPPTALLW